MKEEGAKSYSGWAFVKENSKEYQEAESGWSSTISETH